MFSSPNYKYAAPTAVGFGAKFVSRSPSPWPSPHGEGSAGGSFSFAEDCPANPAPGFSKTQRTFLLLLEGEGRDEGGR